MKTKSIVLIVVSLGFGCVAAVGMVQVMAKSKTAVPRANTKPVLVALCDLDINDELTPENVKVEQWPANMVPEGIVTQWEGNEGRRIAGRVIKGYPIQSNMLLQPGEYSGLNIRRGYRVYAIKASGQSGFAGLLSPGNRVDIVGVVKKSGSREEVAKTFLSNIRVFAVNDETSRTPGDEEGSREIRIVQLEVTHSQAEKLALVESMGSLKLVLRSDTDQYAKDDEPAEEEDDVEESVDDLFGLSNTQEQSTAKTEEDGGFDAGKIVVGLLDAWRSRQDVQASSGYQPRGRHSMTMISSEGTYVYTWTDRNQPPTMSELSGGGGSYQPIGYASPSHGASPAMNPPTVVTPPTSTGTQESEEKTDNSDFTTESDSDLREEVNTPDDYDESVDDDDVDW